MWTPTTPSRATQTDVRLARVTSATVGSDGTYPGVITVYDEAGAVW